MEDLNPNDEENFVVELMHKLIKTDGLRAQVLRENNMNVKSMTIYSDTMRVSREYQVELFRLRTDEIAMSDFIKWAGQKHAKLTSAWLRSKGLRGIVAKIAFDSYVISKTIDDRIGIYMGMKKDDDGMS